jgi:hypothetical protein
MKSRRRAARMGEGKKSHAYRILVENVLGKRSFGRPRRRWRDSIKMGLREIL